MIVFSKRTVVLVAVLVVCSSGPSSVAAAETGVDGVFKGESGADNGVGGMQ